MGLFSKDIKSMDDQMQTLKEEEAADQKPTTIAEREVNMRATG